MIKLTPLLQILAFIFVVYFGWKTWQQINQAKETIKKIEQPKVHGEIPVSSCGYQAQLESIRDVKTMGIIRAVGRNAWLQGYSAALARRIDPAFDIKKQRVIDSLELERILKSE